MLFGILELVLMAVTVWYAIRMYNSMVSKQKNYDSPLLYKRSIIFQIRYFA